MIKKWYAAETFGGVIQLGKAGEGEAVQLAIDVSGWMEEYPGGEIRLYVTPPKPLTPYFADIEMQEDGTATWTIGKADTKYAGSGTLELMMIRGEDTLLKSATASTTIAHSPSANTEAGDAPEVHPTWWEGALDKIGEAQTQALAGVEAAKEAAVGAVEGAFDEEEAAGKAAIQAAGAAQTQAVNSAGAAQQSAIENKAANALASIPEDYTAIDKTVKSLKDFKADAIICDASGSVITLDDASDAHLHGLRIFGKTTQDGTPAPDAPVPLVSAGDGGSIKAAVCGKNLLNYDAWKTVKSAYASYVEFANNGVTITAQNADAYTQFQYNEKNSEYPSEAVIPVVAGEKITLSWEADTDTPGTVYIFGNGDVKSLVSVNNSVAKKLTYTVPFGITYITFRVGVRNAGDTIAYKNIQIERGAAPTPFEPYKDGGSVTLSTPNGLPGIPVSSGGSYTDKNGQMWVCDEIDLERGVYVQRVQNVLLDGNKRYYVNGNELFLQLTTSGFNACVNSPTTVNCMCDRYPAKTRNAVYDNQSVSGYLGTSVSAEYIRLVDNINMNGDAEAAHAFFASHPATVLYILASPIETPLADAEITAYKLMHSIKPNTTVYNDAGAHQAVSYAADTKRYIDSKISELVTLALANQ